MFKKKIQSYNWEDFKRNFINLSIQVYKEEIIKQRRNMKMSIAHHKLASVKSFKRR
jgi:hypothetical protein